MSITSAMFTGVSGLQANGDAMNVIGNNISNVNTVGFKAGRSVFSDMLSETRGNNSQVGRGVQLQAVQNLFTQGASQASENITDVSIQGNGFFAVQNASGTFLTRAGAFHVDGNNNLVNPDGFHVLSDSGAPIVLNNLVRVTKVDTDGTISYVDTNNATQTVKIGLATVNDTTSLEKVGGSLYRAATTPTIAAASAQQQVLSNSLEQSNVDMASEFVKMIVTQRAYSANSKTITTTDQMTQDVLGLIR